jgi:D-3-phosphoglycerate dehydrogenase
MTTTMAAGDDDRRTSALQAVRLNATTYPVEPAERLALEQAGAEWIAIEGQQPEEICAVASQCDALLVVSSRIPAAVIEKLARCRVISRLGAGTDNIDVSQATQQGIVVANVPDFCVHEHAEHTMALLLAFARRLPYMQHAMQIGDWSARHHPQVHRISGKTLGLLGFGSSAQAVAKRASAFGLRLLAWCRSPAKYLEAANSLGVTLVPWDRLLAEADFVSIHLPLDRETRHVVNADALTLMKRTAVLINTARGAIVDEPALVEALQQRRIAGAALDVFEGINVFALPGQVASHPLLDLDNVLLTPHCAGSSVESSADSKIRGARHAAEVLTGHWPHHIVNPHVVPKFPLTGPPAHSHPPFQ